MPARRPLPGCHIASHVRAGALPKTRGSAGAVLDRHSRGATSGSRPPILPSPRFRAPIATSSAVRDHALARSGGGSTVLPVLVAISFCHLLNDMIQSLLPAIYPILKTSFALDFGQIGLITLAFQLTASLLQPLVGLYTDRHPLPYSLAIGMGLTLSGLILLSQAPSYGVVLAAAGPGRHRLLGLPPRILARRPHGLG